MRIFRADEDVRAIDRFGSRGFAHARLALAERAQLSHVRLDAGGLIGYHEAVVPQLLVVVDGSGWVRGEGDERHPVRAGDAVLWERGEGHETGSEGGLTAVVLEADSLELAR